MELGLLARRAFPPERPPIPIRAGTIGTGGWRVSFYWTKQNDY